MINSNLKECKKLLDNYSSIVIGAGAGLSAAAGLNYSGERFINNFNDYISKYKFTDMYSAAFYPFTTNEEFWAYMSRHIKLNRYDAKVGEVYSRLFNLVKNKDYFVLTTNVDYQFYKAGFNSNKIFAIQGDYGKLQCGNKCNTKLYDNKKLIFEMVLRQKNFKIPSEIVPKCPVCNSDMSVNIRKDVTFVEDEHWIESYNRYKEFINNREKILFIEIGVGFNTPGIIRYPFEKMVLSNPENKLIRINKHNITTYLDIDSNYFPIKGDIGDFVIKLLT